MNLLEDAFFSGHGLSKPYHPCGLDGRLKKNGWNTISVGMGGIHYFNLRFEHFLVFSCCLILKVF